MFWSVFQRCNICLGLRADAFWLKLFLYGFAGIGKAVRCYLGLQRNFHTRTTFLFFMSVCTLKSRSLYGFVTVSSGSLRWSLMLCVLLLGRTCCSHIYCCMNFPCYKVSFFLLLSPQPSLSSLLLYSLCICCFPVHAHVHTYSGTHKRHTHFIVHLAVLIFVGTLGSNK